MGIHNLSKFIDEQAPGSKKTTKFDSYFGRKIAIDASMHMYQFLTVIGRVGDTFLSTDQGEETAHLLGMFYRTLRMLNAGIKPIYVFDGKPPELKKQELDKRHQKRTEAEAELEKAREEGNEEKVEKMLKRTVKVTEKHNEECKRLLEIMGVPVVEAVSEAEATCAFMCKEGYVYAVATEDMDALTFGTPKMIRNLMTPASQNKDIVEYELNKVLDGLEMDMDTFVDFCILCGCDYTTSIRGIGPNKAFKFLNEKKNIENIIKDINDKRLKGFVVPDDFNYENARELFKNAEVKEKIENLKWKPIDVERLVEFLVKEKNFGEERVRSNAEKANASRGKAKQNRLEAFFGPAKIISSSTTTTATATIKKRKEIEDKSDSKSKKSKSNVLKKNINK